MAHQYARTGPLDTAAPTPILRHQDRDLYFRAYGDRLGVGSYLHRPMPVGLGDLSPGAQPSMLPFTAEDFDESWAAATDLLPALVGTQPREGFNGVFSFTADGFPLIGEARDVRGFWTAEAVWVTHSVGAARALAQWLVEGRPGVDLHECDLNRFDPSQLSPGYVRERAIRSFVEVYDIIHPLDPPSIRDVRVSPFHARHVELGAVFGEAAELGASAVVRGERGAAAHRGRARRLVGAALVADRRRRGPGHPRGRRPLRHDAADPPRGDRPGLLPTGTHQRRRRPAGRDGGLHPAAR
nr:hypothetical protein GCM10020092_060180 [Actinoplanes digitatis]